MPLCCITQGSGESHVNLSKRIIIIVSKYLETPQVVPLYEIVAKLHERPYCRWRGVELRHLVLVHNAPVSVVLRVEGCAFKLLEKKIKV